jgi:serine protease Do
MGALVAEVVQSGPAAKAGIREGDVVIEFNGKQVKNSRDLPLFAGLIGVGKSVPLTVIRGSKRKTLSITLGAFPDEGPAVAQAEPEAMSGKHAIGLRVSDITQELRSQFKLKRQKGAVIKEVKPGSPASRAGLQAGDVVLKLNGKSVRKAREVVESFKALGSGKIVRMQIARGASRLYLALRTP